MKVKGVSSGRGNPYVVNEIIPALQNVKLEVEVCGRFNSIFENSGSPCIVLVLIHMADVRCQMSHHVRTSTHLFEVYLVLLLLDLHVSVLDKRPRTLLRRIAFHSRGLRSRVHQLLVCESLHLLPLEAIIVTGFATLWNL